MKKEIIKPFDLEKAKAGAKLRIKDGYPVEIFKWDARGDYPIVGIIKKEEADVTACWCCRGSYFGSGIPHPYDLVIVEEVEEPEFKVGDWITNGEYTVKIVEVTDICYECKSNKGSLHIKVIDGADEDYHLWTIKDAKAGDILVDTEGSVFIFRKICEGYPNAYGGINIINEFAHADESGYWTHKPCFPATKEQRDLLFQKMKVAGYKWDAKKLELKKIKLEFWSDTTGAKLEGFFIGCCSNIHKTNSVLCCTSHNIFATEKQAKSARAMARISQIMANDIENFGGAITDEEWKNDKGKAIIYRNGSRICKTGIINDYYFLAFHTEKQRDLFLEKYPQLVMDYLMIPDEKTK